MPYCDDQTFNNLIAKGQPHNEMNCKFGSQNMHHLTVEFVTILTD